MDAALALVIPTPENQARVATGERGIGKMLAGDKPLFFKGCQFHRIIRNFMCQVLCCCEQTSASCFFIWLVLLAQTVCWVRLACLFGWFSSMG